MFSDRTKSGIFSGRALLISICAGVILYLGAVFALDLHSRISRGEKGQKAIQMLDALRRPLLSVKEAEIRLLKTGDTQAAARNLTKITTSAASLLDRYLALTQYNPTLYELATRLRDRYEEWIIQERRLIGHFTKAAADGHEEILQDALHEASDGFMNTMNTLGAGEAPIHHDIDTGHRATRLLMLSSGLLFLYLIGLVFIFQRAKTRELRRSYDQLKKEMKKRQQARAAIQESTKMLKLVLDTIPARVFWKDLDSNYLGCNRIFARDTGLESPRQIIGKSDFELTWADQAKQYRQDDRQVIQTGRPKLRYEEPQTGPDGSRIWLETSKVPLTNLNGDIIGVLGTYQDITGRKQAEEAFRALFQSTVKAVGQEFFEGIAAALCEWLKADSAIIAELTEGDNVQALSMVLDGKTIDQYSYALPGAPCEIVIRKGYCVYPDRVSELFPDDRDLVAMRAKGYVGIPLKDKSGSPIGVLCVIARRKLDLPPKAQDVFEIIAAKISVEIERKRAEQELNLYREHLEELVAQRTVELEASNEELEAFSYSVSHDLRAPLRSIDGFSKAILEDYWDDLDETGRDYLRRVRAASQRMGLLIDDMLKLAHVTRRGLTVTQADLTALARDIETRLQESQPGRQVEFRIQEGLSARGDERLLRIVLENLLGNAWKYTGDTPRPRIEFGGKEKDGETVYYVRDNGAGFNMRYAGKLFAPFQRLHRSDEFEGTGVGLATAQRIVHRHHGRIWAEGEEARGATFYFTLGEGIASSSGGT
ncbi:MAG TPA: PAS domain S-box protein [Sedimenticola sp.]|nr:PAS domain S-box protein [Sedimenticola sp.]